MIGESRRVLRVFLPGKFEADEGQRGQNADGGRHHGRQRAQHQRVLEGVDDRIVLRQLDEPAQADALHRENAELLGVERQHDDHDDRGEHEYVYQDRVDSDQCPSRREVFHGSITLKAFEYLVDSQVAVISPHDDEQQAEQDHADGRTERPVQGPDDALEDQVGDHVVARAA